MKNYYHVLGLDDNATLEDIKMAYKEYALKFHPDKHNNDSFFTERFIEVQEAYDFLVSTQKQTSGDSTTSSSKSSRTTKDSIEIIEFRTDKTEIFTNESFEVGWNILNADCITLHIKLYEKEYVYNDCLSKENRTFQFNTDKAIRIQLIASQLESKKSITKGVVLIHKLPTNSWQTKPMTKEVVNGCGTYFILFIVFVLIFIVLPLIVSSINNY